MKRLLDTNAYSEWKRGDRAVDRVIRRAERLYFSTVVAGELLYGFRHGLRYEANRRELEEFLRSPFVEVVDVSLSTADRYGRVAQRLRSGGTPIPVNDIWIAAQAMETGAELVTFDEHFDRVDGLAWVDPRRE